MSKLHLSATLDLVHRASRCTICKCKLGHIVELCLQRISKVNLRLVVFLRVLHVRQMLKIPKQHQLLTSKSSATSAFSCLTRT